MCPDTWVPLWGRYGWLDPLMCPACTLERLIIWTTRAPNITPFGTSGGNTHHLNAGRELLPEAGAERTLEAVACTRLFGQAVACGPMVGPCPRPSLTGSLSLACMLPRATQGHRRFALQPPPHPPTAWAAGTWLESRL